MADSRSQLIICVKGVLGLFVLTSPDYIALICTRLGLKESQVRAALRLLEDGNTIPFIARYRKEMTGELDENELRAISSSYEADKHLYERKSDVLRLLEEQGILTDEIQAQKLIVAVEGAKTVTEVDDLYRPYRPKRKTRATMAKERGLAPLEAWLRQADVEAQSEDSVVAYAMDFVSVEKGVQSPQEALLGALDIFAESVADDAQTRKWVRTYTMAHGIVKSMAVNQAVESVYELYYDYQEPVAKIPFHRVLAMNRGEREGILKISLDVPADDVVKYLIRSHIYGKQGSRAAAGKMQSVTWASERLEEAVVDAYKRLIAQGIEREIRTQLTAQSEEHAIAVFGENLRQLLMQKPLRQKVVLGVDPAFRTGCKLAVVDDTGKLLSVSVIYPTPPQNKVEAAQQQVWQLLAQFNVSLVAIGNGTASRETEAFIADCLRVFKERTETLIPYVIVSEAGASVYSASPLAGEEFPQLDVSERSAISIARRIQDPLAELVKIDPKSIGVGQYQHDVSSKQLDEKLTAVVETAVNEVGVDVNTASSSLLSYVAGLNKTTAKNIVSFREKNGRFSSRASLAKVPRLGPKTLEQAAGFLRIPDAQEVLDATPIHPESYGVVRYLLKRSGCEEAALRAADLRKSCMEGLRQIPVETLSAEAGVGVPTLRDILAALERPGRDPRDDVPAPLLRTDILKLEDLEVGMVLTGTVRNVVDFGAFVDVGLKNDGLVHISQLSDRFVKHPLDVVSVGDIVSVRVLHVDLQKHRLGLSIEKGV